MPSIVNNYEMELYQIRQFVAVAETGSFTKGASRAGVSQPAISASVAKLEEEMGQKLLDRRQGSVVPTAAGGRLLDAARDILLACNTIKSTLRAASSPQTLRVGVLRTLPTVHVVGVLHAFRQAHPDIQIELFEGPREELEKRLDQKKLDVCLTSLNDAAASKTSVALFTEPYVLAVNQHHRFAKLRSITLDDLQGEPFILRTSCETFQETTALLIARGIRTRLVYRTDQDDRALGLVAAGIGVALMPALYKAVGVVNVHISDFDTKRTIGMRWLDQARENKCLTALVAFACSHPWITDLRSDEPKAVNIRAPRSGPAHLRIKSEFGLTAGSNAKVATRAG
jgi:DNA-binding transcriptional LysR family regulator